MKLLKELNLTPVKKTVGRNPIVQRRESLIKGIDKQLSICESLISDNEFARDHHTGRKIPSWFWLDDSGQVEAQLVHFTSLEDLQKMSFRYFL